MGEALKELLEQYKQELERTKEFTSCFSCCETASLNTSEYLLERIVGDLDKIIN